VTPKQFPQNKTEYCQTPWHGLCSTSHPQKTTSYPAWQALWHPWVWWLSDWCSGELGGGPCSTWDRI